MVRLDPAKNMMLGAPEIASNRLTFRYLVARVARAVLELIALGFSQDCGGTRLKVAISHRFAPSSRPPGPAERPGAVCSAASERRSRSSPTATIVVTTAQSPHGRALDDLGHGRRRMGARSITCGWCRRHPQTPFSERNRREPLRYLGDGATLMSTRS